MYQEFARIAPALMDGRLSMAAGYGHILRTCGAQPRPELMRALVDREWNCCWPDLHDERIAGLMPGRDAPGRCA